MSNRSDYNASYYKKNRDELLKKAKLRYRNMRDELSEKYRNKYTPKHQIHLIYRQ